MSSVPSPLHRACNTTLFCYTPPNSFPPVNVILGDSTIADYLLSPLSRVTMQVCFLYFCRVQELLNAVAGDIVDPDRLVCHGLKRSHSYVVYLPGLSEQIYKSGITDPSTVLFPTTYIKLYRDAVRIGISYHVSGSVNNRILHCARYIFSKQSLKSVRGSELAGVLRHRSLKNYLYYLK